MSQWNAFCKQRAPTVCKSAKKESVITSTIGDRKITHNLLEQKAYYSG